LRFLRTSVQQAGHPSTIPEVVRLRLSGLDAHILIECEGCRLSEITVTDLFVDIIFLRVGIIGNGIPDIEGIPEVEWISGCLAVLIPTPVVDGKTQGILYGKGISLDRQCI
jgi:hypothetical protein